MRITVIGCTAWRKRESYKKQVQEIVQTKYGSLSRLLSINGRLLDSKQRQKETRRIQTLVSHPDEQQKLQLESNKKAEPGTRLFKILPDAFVFSYAGREGELTKLTFKPNPNFQPPSLEARVLHYMEGEMRIDVKQRDTGGDCWSTHAGREIRRRSAGTLGQRGNV